jgi:hypothetical protein
MDYRNYYFKKIGIYFPYILLCLAILGLIIYLVFRRSTSSFVNTAPYLVPVVLAGVALLIKKKKGDELTVPSIVSRLRFHHLLLITTILFIITLIILTCSATRPLSYFVIVGLVSCLIFTQIIMSNRPAWTDYLIIIEVAFVSLDLVWGVTLKYPLYFGYTDLLSHLRWISTVIETRHIDSLGDTYLQFPLYHIFNAICSEITGLSVRNTVFIFIGLVWQIGNIFAYLIFKKLSGSTKFALVATLLFALNSQVVFYGAYAITRSLAFVIVLCWLYLVLNSTKTLYIVLSLIAMCMLILTHHTTVVFTIPILIILYVCERLVSRREDNPIRFKPIAILASCSLTYLFFVAYTFTHKYLPGYFGGIEASPTTIATPAIKPTVFVSLYDSFVILFSLIGIGLVFQDTRPKGILGIALASLIFLPLYLLGQINILSWYGAAMLYRLPLIVSPFLIFVVSYGVAYVINLEHQAKVFYSRILPMPLITIAIVAISVFFSSIYGPNSQDLTYLGYPKTVGSEYFTNAELESFSFMNNNADVSLPLYGDSETTGNDFSLFAFPSRDILVPGDINDIKSGYLIFRAGELKRTGGLTFSSDGTNAYRYYLNQSHEITDITNRLSSTNEIYGDGDVEISLMR